jgi:hypothetical protein
MYNFVPLKLNKLKRVFFLVLYVMLGIICTQIKGQGSALKNEPVVFSQDSTGGFTTIRSGETVYDISEYYYGNGEDWRWIVLKNPFLQGKGRVWQDVNSKKWYCEIFPGEKLYLPSIPNLPKTKEVRKDTVSVIPSMYKEDVDTVFLYKKVMYLLLGMILLLLFGVIFFYLFLRKKQYQELDPVTAGPPQVPGGIDDEQVFGRYENYAHHRFPQAENILIKNIRKGTLSGPAVVHYGKSFHNETKKIDLKDIQAYAGEILADNKEYTVYFLQGCGNDARAGNFMTGKELVFTLEKELTNPKEKLQDLPVTITKDEPNLSSDSSSAKEEIEKESPKGIQEKFLSIVEKAIDKNGEHHKINLEMTSDGELRFSLEPRFTKQAEAKKMMNEGVK